MVSFHGLGRLHATHAVLAILCILNCVLISSKVGPLKSTPFPNALAVELDYNRMHHFSLVCMSINAVVALAAVITISFNIFRRHALYVLYELLWNSVALASQIVNVVLWGLAFPRYLSRLSGGSPQGMLGPDGKLSLKDAAATITLYWILVMLVTALTFLLISLHMAWHLVVSICHRSTQPSVWFQPLSGSYARSLPPGENPSQKNTPGYPIVLMTDYPFKGIGSERTKEWLYTSETRQPGFDPLAV